MLSIAYGFVALWARSRYSSAFFRNASAFDAMAESPITPVNGYLMAFATDLRRTFSMPGSPTIDFPTRDGNRGGS